MSQKGKVYVQAVIKPTATKVSEIVNGKNQKLNQMKISRNIYNVFSVLQSEKTGKLKTGLNKYVDNPYKETDPKDLPNKDFASDITLFTDEDVVDVELSVDELLKY